MSAFQGVLEQLEEIPGLLKAFITGYESWVFKYYPGTYRLSHIRPPGLGQGHQGQSDEAIKT